MRATRMSLQQIVLFEFFAQGVAVDAEHARRAAVIVVGVFHHRNQQRFFDFIDDHFINAARRLAVQIRKILLQGFVDACAQMMRGIFGFFVLHRKNNKDR